MNAHPCTICGEGGHHSRRCPTLSSPLTPGFYAPPAGHRPSGDDEGDESCKIERVIYMPPRIPPPHVYVYSTPSGRRYR
jgi:hypothetical protein